LEAGLVGLNTNKVTVKVPASTANLGPGFDCLGMALHLHAWIQMSVAQETKVLLRNQMIQGVAQDKTNLIYVAAQQVFAKAGVIHPELEIVIYSEIPLARGFGSSAVAIIGGMCGANALIGNMLSQDTLFQMACALEKHPDNVGASLFGGLVVSFWDGLRAEHIRIQPHERIEVLAAVPEFELSAEKTEKARHVLPKEVKLTDAVFNLAHSSLLVAAFCSGQLEMIQHAMKDVLHQPYRAALIPGMSVLLSEGVHHGALGIALSGAGPTILAFVDSHSDRKQQLESFIQDTLLQAQVKVQMMWLSPCMQGAEVLYDQNDL